MLDAQHLALCLVSDLQRDEVVASSDSWLTAAAKAAASTEAAAAATTPAAAESTTKDAAAGTSRDLEELSEILQSTGKCALKLFLCAFAECCGKSTTASATTAATTSVAFTRTRIPHATRSQPRYCSGLTTTAAEAATTTPSTAA